MDGALYNNNSDQICDSCGSFEHGLTDEIKICSVCQKQWAEYMEGQEKLKNTGERNEKRTSGIR